MRELIELTADELDLVSGGAATAAAASGDTSASAASGAALGVTVVRTAGIVVAIVPGSVSAGPAGNFGLVTGPANLGSAAGAN